MSRICIIGPSKLFFSGISACTICLANALLANNDVSVVLLRRLLPRFLYPGRHHLDRNDYLFDFFSGVDVFDGMNWNDPLSWLKSYNFLRKQKPDILIVPWWTSSVAHMLLFLSFVSRLKKGRKLILDIHEIIDPLEQSIFSVRLYARIMGKLLMKSADVLVVHSRSVKSQLIKIYGVNKDKVFVIPLGLFNTLHENNNKLAIKEELEIKENLVILYFGIIRKYKGLPYLVKAFNNLPNSVINSSRLMIIGEDWKEENDLEKMINSSPFKGHITYNPQFIPDAMILKYFSAADVVVLPYLRTSGSAVANIAMTYGVPIITSDIATMRECLMDYEGAIFVPPADYKAIAEKLFKIYSLASSGKTESYNPPWNMWDEVAKHYERLIESLYTK